MLSSSVHHQPLLNLGLSSGGSETRKFIPDLEDPRVWRGRKRGGGWRSRVLRATVQPCGPDSRVGARGGPRQASLRRAGMCG